MKNYKIGSRLLKPVLLVGLILFTFNSAFCQWQATMTTTLFGSEQEYEVYSDLEQYRYEYEDYEVNSAVIVNPEANVSSIMVINDKLVHHTPTDGRLSYSNDVVQSLNHYLRDGGELIEEYESLDGYDCIKKSVIKNGETIYTQWFSEKLNFPIKIVDHLSSNQNMYLMNIRPWTIEPEKFIVPDDFTEADKNLRPIEK